MGLRALALFGLVLAQVPAPPSRWVTDQTGTVPPAQVAALDAELEAFERSTGHQLVVFVGRTTGGEPIEDWAAKTFEAWKVGRAKLDDGAALFVMLDDRAARIEVGYGLEDRLTDAQSARIMRGVIVPRLAKGDVGGGVTEGARAIISALGGEAQPGPPAFTVDERVKWGAFAVFAALFLAFAIWKPRTAWFLLMMLFNSRRRGSGSGGGFHGGGGRSGGGGATGRW
jgi:uncharacterized protein